MTPGQPAGRLHIQPGKMQAQVYLGLSFWVLSLLCATKLFVILQHTC